MSEIFSKTAKGQEEIKTRTAGLSQRMRQVLIFVDGKRSRDDLHGMLKGDDMDDLLHSLVEQGFIEVIGTTAKTTAATAAQPAPAASTEAPIAAVTAPAVAKPEPKVPEPPKLTNEEIAAKRKREEEQQAELNAARGFMSRM